MRSSKITTVLIRSILFVTAHAATIREDIPGRTLAAGEDTPLEEDARHKEPGNAELSRVPDIFNEDTTKPTNSLGTSITPLKPSEKFEGWFGLGTYVTWCDNVGPDAQTPPFSDYWGNAVVLLNEVCATCLCTHHGLMSCYGPTLSYLAVRDGYLDEDDFEDPPLPFPDAREEWRHVCIELAGCRCIWIEKKKVVGGGEGEGEPGVGLVESLKNCYGWIPNPVAAAVGAVKVAYDLNCVVDRISGGRMPGFKGI